MSELAKPLSTVSEDFSRLPQGNSLFERFAWFYILCREKLFRDDTARMIAALWGNSRPRRAARLVELGCGPGFYARKLASLFPELEVRGLDRSGRQLAYAQEHAAGIKNCRFEVGDVLGVTRPSGSFDYIVASRLFTVLRDPDQAVAEMFRILDKGGRCFIAEPRFRSWASIPLSMMWLAANLSGSASECVEPGRVRIYGSEMFEEMFRHQPWQDVRVWRDGRYHYALCQKN